MSKRGVVKSVGGHLVYLHPKIPNHVSLARARVRAAREGKCNGCRLRSREDGMRYCGVCRDRKWTRDRTSGRVPW